MKKIILVLAIALAGSMSVSALAQTPCNKQCDKAAVEKCEKKCDKADCKKVDCKKVDCKKAECKKADCKKVDCKKTDCKKAEKCVDKATGKKCKK